MATIKIHDNGVVETDGAGPDDATCGYCHRSWDESVATALTPPPSGRCPFEYDHDHEAPAPPRSSAVARRIQELKDEFREATGDEPDDYVMSEDDWAFGLGTEGAAELVGLLEEYEEIRSEIEADR